MEGLTHELAKLRAGGRFNPEVIENLRVTLVKGSGATERLGDIAQVIAVGRRVKVVVGEKEVGCHLLWCPRRIDGQDC